MTYQARRVLNDCSVALSLLEEEEDLQRWRIHWAAAVALIRAVGSVLDKVDGKDPEIKAIQKRAYKQWKGDDPKHEIFREFIERERNNVLKEYRSEVYPLEKVAVAIEFTASPVDGGEEKKFRQVAEIAENIYRPMADGPWEGDDASDVLASAIQWWNEQLTAIEVDVFEQKKALNISKEL